MNERHYELLKKGVKVPWYENWNVDEASYRQRLMRVSSDPVVYVGSNDGVYAGLGDVVVVPDAYNCVAMVVMASSVKANVGNAWVGAAHARPSEATVKLNNILRLMPVYNDAYNYCVAVRGGKGLDVVIKNKICNICEGLVVAHMPDRFSAVSVHFNGEKEATHTIIADPYKHRVTALEVHW